MRYDFRKLQAAIEISGKTQAEIEELTGLHQTTISRVLRTGRARQSTALQLTKAFKISMKEIQAPRGRRRVAA